MRNPKVETDTVSGNASVLLGDGPLVDHLATLTVEEARELRNQLSLWLTKRPHDHSEQRKLRIYINRKLADMSPNKRAAHAVHAALAAFGVHPGTKVIVLDKGPTEIEKMNVAIHDGGYTELEPGTLTAGTNWPEDSEP